MKQCVCSKVFGFIKLIGLLYKTHLGKKCAKSKSASCHTISTHRYQTKEGQCKVTDEYILHKHELLMTGFYGEQLQ